MMFIIANVSVAIQSLADSKSGDHYRCRISSFPTNQPRFSHVYPGFLFFYLNNLNTLHALIDDILNKYASILIFSNLQLCCPAKIEVDLFRV